LVNDQLTAVLAGRAIGIVTKAVLRTGSGDRWGAHFGRVCASL